MSTRDDMHIEEQDERIDRLEARIVQLETTQAGLTKEELEALEAISDCRALKDIDMFEEEGDPLPPSSERSLYLDVRHLQALRGLAAKHPA